VKPQVTRASPPWAAQIGRTHNNLRRFSLRWCRLRLHTCGRITVVDTQPRTGKLSKNRDIPLLPSAVSAGHRDRDRVNGPSQAPSPSPENAQEMRSPVIGRPFQPGWKGGPGRPAGVAAMIRAQTRDGLDIVTFLVKCMRDELYPWRRLRPADRLEASRLLAERVWGRVPLSNGDEEQPKVIVLQLNPGQDF
jgi:hypothetical protein